ncbi:DUF4479 domain-containing protein [Oceanobacillus caeni]|uniref:DUF4479 domain-containing protein n=1 Tax=Oceanobacillus caeni TaxID=405946 RepID=UPI002E238380|nr:DUF4479 domain-containing protein [Oceanobacillus caeni]
MDVFYNPDGIGDVLIIPIEDGDRYDIKFEKIADITRILSSAGKVIGYNIFNAKSHFQLNQTGKIKLTEELLSQIKNLFMLHCKMKCNS